MVGTQTPTGADTAAVVRRGLSRVLHSTWGPVLLRLVGGAAALTALAGIGAASLVVTPPGVAVAASEEARLPGAPDVWVPPAPRPTVAPRQPSPPDSQPAAEASTAPLHAAPSASAAPARQPGLTADGRVILNEANAEELTRLPRVGPKRAQKIVALRTRLRRFRRITDLLRVRGIGVKTLRKMAPKLVLNRPKAPPPAASAKPP